MYIYIKFGKNQEAMVNSNCKVSKITIKFLDICITL